MTKYKVLKADTNHGIYEFLIDKASDLKVLPKKTGSTAFVIDTGEKYICSNTKE